MAALVSHFPMEGGAPPGDYDPIATDGIFPFYAKYAKYRKFAPFLEFASLTKFEPSMRSEFHAVLTM